VDSTRGYARVSYSIQYNYNILRPQVIQISYYYLRNKTTAHAYE